MWFLRILLAVHEKRKLEIPLILSSQSFYRGGPESQKDLPKITCQRRTGARTESKAQDSPLSLSTLGGFISQRPSWSQPSKGMEDRGVNHVSIYRGEGRVQGKQQGWQKHQRLAKPFAPLGQGQEKEPLLGP